MPRSNWVREYAGVYKSVGFGYEIWKDASEPGMWDLRLNGKVEGTFFTLKAAKQASGLL